ncbi:ABA4-like family protein [Roseicyclus sp.]|uniref:ABA4-like family protein n=1 Tax=Roseicyclus sp. TaxID=1914329 RepID=UPI003F6BDF94
MAAETLFTIANPFALLGWIALAFAPLAPRWADLMAGWIIPGLLSLGYAVLILVHWADAPGGYSNLDAVQALFTDPDIALAGWLHFLAFDLFIGAWIVRHARAQGERHLVILPILPFAFLFGPIGLAAYFALRLVRRSGFSTPQEVL